jgi:hypothetical protein
MRFNPSCCCTNVSYPAWKNIYIPHPRPLFTPRHGSPNTTVCTNTTVHPTPPFAQHHCSPYITTKLEEKWKCHCHLTFYNEQKLCHNKRSHSSTLHFHYNLMTPYIISSLIAQIVIPKCGNEQAQNLWDL